jgi:hypothetical protein
LLCSTSQEELNKIRDDLRIARILIERYQEELRKVNETAPNLQIDRNLLELFRRAKKALSEEEICYELTSPKIEFMLDSEEDACMEKACMLESKSVSWNEIQTTDIEAIAKQLETLEMMV